MNPPTLVFQLSGPFGLLQQDQDPTTNKNEVFAPSSLSRLNSLTPSFKQGFDLSTPTPLTKSDTSLTINTDVMPGNDVFFFECNADLFSPANRHTNLPQLTGKLQASVAPLMSMDDDMAAVYESTNVSSDNSDESTTEKPTPVKPNKRAASNRWKTRRGKGSTTTTTVSSSSSSVTKNEHVKNMNVTTRLRKRKQCDDAAKQFNMKTFLAEYEKKRSLQTQSEIREPVNMEQYLQQLRDNLDSSSNDEDINDKKERNKISAARYRKRRKMYLTTLETEVSTLVTQTRNQDSAISVLLEQNKQLQAQLDAQAAAAAASSSASSSSVSRSPSPELNDDCSTNSSQTSSPMSTESSPELKAMQAPVDLVMNLVEQDHPSLKKSPLFLFALFSCFLLCGSSLFVNPADVMTNVSPSIVEVDYSNHAPMMSRILQADTPLMETPSSYWSVDFDFPTTYYSYQAESTPSRRSYRKAINNGVTQKTQQEQTDDDRAMAALRNSMGSVTL